VAHDVHEVRGVAAVEHAEPRVEPEARCVLADQPVADRVERARPRQSQVLGHARRCLRLCGERLGHHPLRAARHLERGAPREREQQHALRRHAGEQQVRDAVGERAGLARARAGNHEQRARLHAAAVAPLAVRDGGGLGGVQRGESSRGGGHRGASGLYG
jgi:hypothetical protein